MTDKDRNFELPRVKSINASGHKFGLVYAGLGWIIWRDEAFLPKHLIFELHYLGGTEESYTLNFSRPGAQVICQYYNLIHLGFDGYRQIMENCLSNARLLSKSLEATGWYTCVSDIHRKKGDHSITHILGESAFGKLVSQETSADYNAGLPVVAFRFSDAFKTQFPHIPQDAVSNLLRTKEYIVPNYPLPPTEEKTEILRVVVRESMSLDLLDRLIADICAVTQTLMECEPAQVAFWQSGGRGKGHRHANTSAERQLASKGARHGEDHGESGERPMSTGVHISVC
jgi:glutamate decarboxylase